MAPLDGPKGIWKRKGTGRSRVTPKGRQAGEDALAEVRATLADRPRRRDLLIEFLHLLQDRFGFLSEAHLCALAEEMRLSQAEVFEVATFYAHFDVVAAGQTPPPELTIRVCSSLSCRLQGAEALTDALRAGTDPARVRVLRGPCMGRCDSAPTVAVGQNYLGHATPDSVLAAAAAGQTAPRRIAHEDLAAYRAGGGYSVLERLRAGGDREATLETVLAAGLRGLGGAGFPAGMKTRAVRGHPGPRYLAVNGDEGEPGTFKDRFHLETRPHLFLEGMLIAAWGIEADRCYIYLRDEYPEIRTALQAEIAALETAGLAAPGYIELRRGAGAYICGEESAMIESLEGKRGLPRHRPPFVAEVGLFGRPTLVHNVETLHWVTRILREGPQIMTSVVHNDRVGLRSYSVSGRVARPGVYELSAGSTVREVIAAAGGMAEGHVFKAYQPGGPSSGILPAALGDVPLDFDMLQPLGTFIGSAAVVILSDRDSVRDAAVNMLRFFEDESCGQCTPCRVGCEKAVKLMQAEHWDAELLEDLCQVMTDASICGLGQAAPNPIRLTLKHFPEEVCGDA
ncbi:NAD(P)H-dependent oxidoreductase subunit E [Tropicimonas sp. IMCC34043]|uniref:NAD(P)H-dependent oxidoreductase subunit E n=1 Tax=Tropicimonas sp. IMCC34043 TaxID=2248760 RepID=UPI000E27CA68|nr:NAD(P)H-dependent oxidoreductase subunit E [Tropicimonas sp. IMCC34043]